ncbi:MAG: sulfite exporter TauE/SafE family protein [Anaerolineae bacterium]|nr:sulfite exporter TauE/SafE family protein [Anaerolineae bacterium]
MIEGWDYLFIALAAIAAGAINALAGGGTLISFPVLIAVGVPPVASNITNTVSLLPGYIGGTLAQWADIKTQMKRLWLILPASIVGGLLGGILLIVTGEEVFGQIVPYLILLASLLLAVQDPVRAWLLKRAAEKGNGQVSEFWSTIPIGLASVYGGYFGAGLSVIVLAALGLTVDESLTKLNALKQAVSFSVNVAAAVFFVFSGYVVWNVVLVMAVAALIGGWLGGKLAGSIKPNHLRWLVVSIGVVVGIIYLIRG